MNWDQRICVSAGLGVNSTAMLVGMQERGIRPQAILFADTGGEKPSTYDWADQQLRPWLKDVGFPPVRTVRYVPPRSSYRTLEQECLQNAHLPGLVYGFRTCSEKWKIRPQEQWYKLTGLAWRRVLGIAADEAHRAKHAEFWYPLVEWDWGRSECFDALERAGLKAPCKSSCFFCPASTKRDVLWLSRAYPDLFARAVAMEDNARAKGNLKRVKGLGRHWSWRELVEADEEQLKLFPEAPVPACACMDS